MKLKVKNWGEYQHYKDRNPPWIKLHKKLLDDPDFMSLSFACMGLAQLLWLLASESKDGEIDASMKNLTFRTRKSQSEIEKHLSSLIDSGFFIVLAGASGLQASDTESCSETETETEGDIEKFGEFKNVKLTSDEYQKLKERFNGSCDDYIERLSAYLAQSGKRYKSHYATILNWSRKDQKESSSKSIEQDKLDKPWMYGG